MTRSTMTTRIAPLAVMAFVAWLIAQAGTANAVPVGERPGEVWSPPGIMSGAVEPSGATITLRFDAPLDALFDLPAPGAFTITVSGRAIAASRIAMIPTDGRGLRLGGLSDPIPRGHRVLVSYVGAQARDDAGSLGPRTAHQAVKPFTGHALVNTSRALVFSSGPNGGRAIHRRGVTGKVSSSIPLPAAPVRRASGDMPGDRLKVGGGDILVDIQANVDGPLLARIAALGGRVVDSAPRYRSLRALMPLPAISALAWLDAVSFIEPAGPTITRKINTSEGDVAQQAKTGRTTYGVSGSGIGIGVISNGVDSLARLQASGDLPASVTVLPGQAGSGDEGTAMLEIIHDLAPDAELYFARGFDVGQARFAANVEALCAAGADIIVDDVLFIAEGAFQDDIAARGVNAATDAGCFVISAAGNDGNLHSGTSGVWEGDFVRGGRMYIDGLSVGGYHDYGGVTGENALPAAFQGFVSLQWSDPLGASTNDYDLYIVDSNGDVVAESVNTQAGTQDPIEWVSTGTEILIGARIIVVKRSGSTPRYLRIQAFVGGHLQFATSGTTLGHAAAENAIGVGQVDIRKAGGSGGVFDGTETIEYDSADGPRRLFFEPDGTAITAGDFSATGGKTLQRPDFVAAACVSTATAGYSQFCGTSAAAPHAAAIAALVLEAAGGPGSLTLAELRAVLTDPTATLDIEDAGTDNVSGAGILMAPGAIAAAKSLNTSENTAPTSSATGLPITVDGRGTVALDGTASDTENDTLTYAWTSNGGGTFVNSSALDTMWTAPKAASTSQIVTLTLTVTDDGAGTLSDSATVTITVRANQAPTAMATGRPTTVDGLSRVTLDGTGTDPDGDTLTYGWTSDGGGSFANASALSTTWTAPAKTNSVQRIRLTLTVTDNGAGMLSDVATVALTVRANRAPGVSVDPVSTTVYGGARVTLDGTASDPDGDRLTIAWSSDGGGSFANDKALDTTWTAPAATAASQSITLTLRATDATMASDTATVLVTVRANQAPEVSVAPDSATVGGSNSLGLDGTATDSEGGNLTYAWSSDGGGSFANDKALDTNWTAPAATASAQHITLTLTVTDDGAVARVGTATVSITVPERGNAAPTVSATTSTSTVLGGGTVGLDGTASDPQNDPLTYAWTSNGGGAFANSSALDTTWTAPDAGVSDRDVTLTLTVTDTNNASATATVRVTMRKNQAPSAFGDGQPGHGERERHGHAERHGD